METIGRRSENLLHFVERYREMATLPKPVFRQIEIDRFVNGLSAVTRQEITDLDIAFDVQLAGSAQSILADAELLERAILNLLRNAIEAVQERADGRIKLRAQLNEARCFFAVADNGPGLRTEEIEEIFVPFFTTKEMGTGIGLPLARQIALLHGGTLTARPNPDAGVTFELAIPARALVQTKSRVERGQEQ